MESLRATKPLRLSGIVLIPIQRVRVERFGGFWGFSIRASAEPHALVIAEEGLWRAIDLKGNDTPLEPLLRETSGLAEAIRTSS